LLSTATELRGGKPDLEPPAAAGAAAAVAITAADRERGAERREAPEQPIQLDKAIEPDRERPFVTSGALCRVTLDLEHWLPARPAGQTHATVASPRVTH